MTKRPYAPGLPVTIACLETGHRKIARPTAGRLTLARPDTGRLAGNVAVPETKIRTREAACRKDRVNA